MFDKLKQKIIDWLELNENTHMYNQICPECGHKYLIPYDELVCDDGSWFIIFRCDECDYDTGKCCFE
jgi:hypothetical protein